MERKGGCGPRPNNPVQYGPKELIMPYSEDHAGIYKIVNTVSNKAYVGQSLRVRKRVAEHFRLLRLNKHRNQHLQRSYNKHGEEAFIWSLEAECESADDLDRIENAFLSGEAYFDEPLMYNIADYAKVPMRGKTHTAETKQRISAAKKGNKGHVTSEYRKRLQDAQLARFGKDPEFVARVRYIVNNPHMSYAERGRVVGLDTSRVRRLALRYTPMKETLSWLKHS
jgi:group I intron endonuclease